VLSQTLDRAVNRGFIPKVEKQDVYNKILQVANKHNFAPDDFARLTLMESDGMNPKASNSRCHGIIQFCDGPDRGAASAGFGANPKAILGHSVLQQLDTPAKIYNDPANLFVAQFIGSPPMNVVHGSLEGSTFQTRGGKVEVPVSGRLDKAILGARPEDCAVTAPGQGNLAAEIYTVELIGDHTLVTVKAGEDMLTVKAHKDFAGATGENIGISFSKDRLFVFDAATGTRVR
jgi:hypothetical protein